MRSIMGELDRRLSREGALDDPGTWLSTLWGCVCACVYRTERPDAHASVDQFQFSRRT